MMKDLNFQMGSDNDFGGVLGQNLFACPTFVWKRTKIDVNRQKRPRFGQ